MGLLRQSWQENAVANVWTSTVVENMWAEINRRLDKLENRVEWLDEHGTRQMGAVIAQLSELSKDIGKLEGLLTKSVRSFWGDILKLVAVMLPMYAAVIALLVK